MRASILKKKNAVVAPSGPPNWNDEQDSPVTKKGETMTLLEQNAKQREEAARLASYNASVSLPPVSLPRTGQHFALSRIYLPCSEAVLYLQEIFELKTYSDLASSMETTDDGRSDFVLARLNSLKKTPQELKDDALDTAGTEFMLRFPQEFFEITCMKSLDRMMARLKASKEISFVLDPLTRKILERVLFRAFQIKDIDIVKKVLQWDINIDSSDLFGTPLMYAASWGNAEHVRLLLERGAFVSSSNLHGTTSAHKAAEYGFDDVLRELISFGADVNCKDVLSTRPLHCAMHGDHADAAALLIAAGADINAPDGSGFTCLHIAVAKKHLKSVCLLVQHPTLQLNLRSPSGRTALHFAAEIGEEFEHLYIMEQLLEQACDVNAQDKNKCTPLHLAMAMPHYKIAFLLVKGGASVLISDNKEKTAAEMISLVPGENGLRLAIHEAKRRELAGESYDKDSVSFVHEGEPGAAVSTTRRTYKEIAESESRYIEMVKEQEEVLAAYKKDTAKMRLRFKEKVHDALVKGGFDRPSSASTHDSDSSRDRESHTFDDRKQSDFVLQVMEGLVFCTNCERQLPSVVNIPEQLRSSFYTFCSHCGFKGPCSDLVEALQSLKLNDFSSFKLGTSTGPPTRSSELSTGIDDLNSDFVYLHDATFCPQCERQLPFQLEMPSHQRESAHHFCPHCCHPNPSDGGKTLDSTFKAPRLYASNSRPSSAMSSSVSVSSFHFESAAQFCQYCEHMLALQRHIPPDDRNSAYNHCPHCGSSGPLPT